MELITIKNLEKKYSTHGTENAVFALKDINLSIKENEFVAIMGESGSGKTTLLNMIATIDTPTKGTVFFQDIDLFSIKLNKREKYRQDNVGLIFQDFKLLDNFTLKENIILPLVLKGYSYSDMQSKIKDIVSALALDSIIEKYPYEVSGGQKQRAAIARALIVKPKLLLADEPTGSLDSKSSKSLLKLMQDINQKGQTIIMVTHSIKAASYADKIIWLQDGRVYEQINRKEDKVIDMVKYLSNKIIELEEGDNE